jgi:hypothetical protein
LIKAEIQVGPQQYVIEFPEAKSLEEAYNEALAIAMGNKISKGPDGWLDLNKKDYDHIRVYKEKQDPLAGLPFGNVQPPNILQPQLENPAIIKRRLDYLGQKIDLEVAEYYDEDLKAFILPYKIVGQPALTMMGYKNLEPLATAYAQQERHIDYEIVLPHGPIIDDQEALAFVKDYAEETEAERERLLKDTDKTARGFSWPTEKE